MLPNEAEVPEVERAQTEIAALYAALALPEAEDVAGHLEGVADDYDRGDWNDALHHVREALGKVIKHIAFALSQEPDAPPLPRAQAAEERIYLQTRGLLSEAEVQSVRYVYTILSEEGSHAGIGVCGAHEAARTFRQVGLALAHYLLLKYQARRGAG